MSPTLLPVKKVAFQGALGAYSDLACRAVFPTADTLPCASFEEAFAAVREDRADRAMIPVENVIAGRVADVHLLIPSGGLYIVGEHFQRVMHHLLAIPTATKESIKEVYSHPQALAQCHDYLKRHGYTAVVAADTAGAAAEVSTWADPTKAAIASGLAGEMYQLTSLEADIADMKGNTTRFMIFSKLPELPRAGAAMMTSLLFTLRSTPAALFKALGGFATCGVNITRIESYAVGGAFASAQFFIDVEGHPEEGPLKKALEELAFFASEIRVLGTYPAHPYRRAG